METILNYLVLGSGFLIIALILIQTRGASLGSGFGGGEGSGENVRRGSEKTIYQITIVLIVVFALSLVAGFFIE